MTEKANVIIRGFDLFFYCETESIIEAIAEKLGNGEHAFADCEGTATYMFSQPYMVTPAFCVKLQKKLRKIGNDFERNYECEYRFSELYLRADDTARAELMETGHVLYPAGSILPEAFPSEAGESKNL